MRSKILLFMIAALFLTVAAQATVVKGSVGSQGSKSYTFTANSTGTVLLSLIFDSASADLDINLAVQDGANLKLIAASESELKQAEQLQTGILGDIKYFVVIKSAQGASPFRLNFDGTFSTRAAGAAGAVSQQIQLKEVKPDAALNKLLKEIEQIEKITKKR